MDPAITDPAAMAPAAMAPAAMAHLADTVHLADMARPLAWGISM